uniref:Uncharacterized protein n=1 Tax=Acinetobacter phage P919 TaxID=3229763 RepID=A0AB39AIP7_9CAUD
MKAHIDTAIRFTNCKFVKPITHIKTTDLYF